MSNVSSIFLVTTYLLIVYNAPIPQGTLIVIIIFFNTPIPQGSISCALLGYAGYYTSMAMFAWMTVMMVVVMMKVMAIYIL